MKLLNMCLCALLLLCTLSCEKDDDNNCQGIDCLPPITQTGAGTFGCLVNGEPYFAFGGLNAQYQLIDGQYYFLLGFDRDRGLPESINLFGNSQITENSQYVLESPSNNAFYANVIFELDEQTLSFIENSTNTEYTGILNISKLDLQNKIVSGTFEFEILHPEDGQVYQITEGRFDSFYAQ